MEPVVYNTHAKTYSYHQASKNDATAHHYLRMRHISPTMSYASITSAVKEPVQRSATRAARVISYHMPIAPVPEPVPEPEIISDLELRMSASVGGRSSGCICVFCEYQFTQEIRNPHQAERRAMDFCNGTIHGDFCKNCLQSGGIMRLNDVSGQNIGAIRELLTDLINTRNIASYVDNIVN